MDLKDLGWRGVTKKLSVSLASTILDLDIDPGGCSNLDQEGWCCVVILKRRGKCPLVELFG